MDNELKTSIKAALEEERESIEHQLEEYGAAVGGEGIDMSGNEGFADSAQATAERSEALATVERLQETWKEVKAALERLEDGSYGTCERCGAEIADARLEARPTARLCLKCKQEVGD